MKSRSTLTPMPGVSGIATVPSAASANGAWAMPRVRRLWLTLNSTIAGAGQCRDELQAVAGQQMGQPGMRHQVDVGSLGQLGDLLGHGDAAAAREIRLDHIDAALADEAFEIPDRRHLLAGRDRHGAAART